jgi:hypothetical protein
MKEKERLISIFYIWCLTFVFMFFISAVCLQAQEQKKEIINEKDTLQKKTPDAEKNWLELEREKINTEVHNVKCDFKDVEEIFGEYLSFFGYSWNEVKEKYKCEDMVNFVMPMEKKRWTFDVNIITPSEGIPTGNLILYGHYIRPPYKIEINYEKVKMYINNVEYASCSERSPERGQYIKKRQRTSLEEQVEKYLDKAESNDIHLKYAFIRYIKEKVVGWMKEDTKEKVLQKLKDYLDELKEREKIRDYWIYDPENLLFDIKCWYLNEWDFDIPKRFFYTKEQIEQNPILGYTDEQLKQYEKEQRITALEVFHEELKSLLGASEDDAMNLYSSVSLKSFGALYGFTPKLFALLSDGNEYQKIVVINRYSPESHARIAKELVFNCNKEDYSFLLKKIMKVYKVETR